MPENFDSVCLFSAGLDSSVALASFRADGHRILAVTVDYGQRARAAEARQARRLCERWQVPHRQVDLPFFAALSGGALLDPKAPLPRPDRRMLDAAGPDLQETARRVWVPNRNGVLINVAAAIAESLGARFVVTGFNREEAATFKDNSAEFVEAVNASLRYSTRNSVEVVSPTLHLSKSEIALLGRALGVPFDLLWPCYESGDRWCEECESCGRFRRAMEACGWTDPPGSRG